MKSLLGQISIKKKKDYNWKYYVHCMWWRRTLFHESFVLVYIHFALWLSTTWIAIWNGYVCIHIDIKCISYCESWSKKCESYLPRPTVYALYLLPSASEKQPGLRQFKCKCRLPSHFSRVLGSNDANNNNNGTNIYWAPVMCQLLNYVLYIYYFIYTLQWL